MKTVTITKIAEKEDAEVPNNIFVGYSKSGIMLNEPNVGDVFILFAKFKTTVVPIWHTSTVKKILADGTFETLNSRYKLEEVQE